MINIDKFISEKSVTGIYCDQLVDVIDSLVETKPN